MSNRLNPEAIAFTPNAASGDISSSSQRLHVGGGRVQLNREEFTGPDTDVRVCDGTAARTAASSGSTAFLAHLISELRAWLSLEAAHKEALVILGALGELLGEIGFNEIVSTEEKRLQKTSCGSHYCAVDVLVGLGQLPGLWDAELDELLKSYVESRRAHQLKAKQLMDQRQDDLAVLKDSYRQMHHHEAVVDQIITESGSKVSLEECRVLQLRTMGQGLREDTQLVRSHGVALSTIAQVMGYGPNNAARDVDRVLNKQCEGFGERVCQFYRAYFGGIMPPTVQAQVQAQKRAKQLDPYAGDYVALKSTGIFQKDVELCLHAGFTKAQVAKACNYSGGNGARDVNSMLQGTAKSWRERADRFYQVFFHETDGRGKTSDPTKYLNILPNTKNM